MNAEFQKNGYLVVREFFNESTVKLMQTYWDLKWQLINYSEEEKNKAWYSKKIGEHFTKFDDDVGNSYNFFSDNLMESLELIYGKKVCKILELNLSPTYTFTRIYEKYSPLIPHQDRESCEISATFPIFVSDDLPSQICISNKKFWEITDIFPPPKYSIEAVSYTHLTLPTKA